MRAIRRVVAEIGIAAILGASSLLTLQGCKTAPEPSFQNELEQGDLAERVNDVESAYEHYSTAVRMRPGDEVAWTRRLKAAKQLAPIRYRQCLTECIGALGSTENLLSERARASIAMGDLSSALDDANETLRRNPRSIRGLRDKAYVQLGLGHWSEARGTLEDLTAPDLVKSIDSQGFALWHWIACVMTSDREAAQAGIREAFSGGSVTDDQTWKVGRFLLGATSEGEFLQLESEAEGTAGHTRLAEAYFFVGLRDIQNGATDQGLRRIEFATRTRLMGPALSHFAEPILSHLKKER